MGQEIKSQTSGKKFKMENSGNATFQIATGKYLTLGGNRLYFFTTAITANTTLTDAPVGSFAITSHATGAGSIYRSDATKWQFLVNA